MTTLDFDAIAVRLESAGMRFRAVRVAHGLAMWALLVLPVAAGAIFAAGLFAPPSYVLMMLLVGPAVLAVYAYFRLVHQPLWQRPTHGQIARWIEENGAAKNLGLQNDLINAVLLSQEVEEAGGRTTNSLIPAVIGEIAVRTADVNLDRSVLWARHFKGISAGAITTLLLGIVIGLFPGPFGHGLKVLANPFGYVPKVGSARITGVEPGDDTVLAGQSINFVASVESPDGKIVDASLAMTLKSGKIVTVPMAVFGSDNHQYRYSLAAATEDMDYIISVGKGSDITQSKRFHISVVPEIHLTNFHLQITPPEYTGKDSQDISIAGKDLSVVRGSIDAAQGSAITVSVSLDGPARTVLLDPQGGQPIVLAAGEGRMFTADLTLRNTIRYSVCINDGAGRTLKRYPEEASGSFAPVSIADRPPIVLEVTEPGQNSDAKPRATVQFAASMGDDIGLTEVRLETAHIKAADKKAPETWTTAKAWTFDKAQDGKPARLVSVRTALTLDPQEYVLGDTLKYRFVAVDNRMLRGLGDNGADLGHQTTTGEVFSISVNDTAAAAVKSSQLWDELRKQLQAILEKQVALRKTVREAKPKDVAEAKGIAHGVADGQTSVRADIDRVAKTFPFEAKMKIIQKTLEVLALEDATTAIDRAGDLSLVSDLKAAPALAGKLIDSQNRIVSVLETLLAIAASGEDEANQIAASTGGDIPNNPTDMWKKLEEKLKEFEKQQKQVMDTTADLAKKPKDQWDKEDQDKAKAAAAIEDKWEKFLTEQLLDMSKLAEQDQGNATILEEIVQMKVELAMAKDALQAKATEVATPLEENGLEDAKALDTHIERWLQQHPDQIKWQMEDALAQNPPPMSELPKQLQDMMGDLMQQQEDLTQDMESTAGKFADSLNKGAGWDAMDGPISNMSAQGVTGNQMPKDMEIQGRSGDGREGRSSGEMVGGTAEDKGGRQTPTRMTNEPFSQGSIDDKAQQPAGGATGGGKKGGMGGEGLEGNAPDKNPNDPTQRMAQKQAELRNQAERLALQMHAAGYSQEKLFEAVTLMQKAEDSIKANRYDNAAAYQQQAADDMNTAKLLSSGQMHVTLDTTPQASGKAQKDMQDAMNGAMPKGYADPVKAYFERLARPGN